MNKRDAWELASVLVLALLIFIVWTRPSPLAPIPTPPRRVCVHAEIEEIPYEDQGVVTMVWGPHCVEWVEVQPGD